ncbi:MAG: Holliday junction resolvase RuvX [Pirellulaceae bacterium]
MSLPETGRIAGIDFGTVRIGIAITDPAQSLASPYEIYQVKNPRLDEKYFREFARNERLVGFVVGLPVHLSGQDSQISIQAEEFAKWLRELTGLPVLLFDERFTSAFADEVVREAGLTRKKRKQLLDKLAAQILLSNYLESKASRGGGNSASHGIGD